MWQNQCFFSSKSHKELPENSEVNAKSDLPPWELDPKATLYERVFDASYDGEKVFRGTGVFKGNPAEALLIHSLN